MKRSSDAEPLPRVSRAEEAAWLTGYGFDREDDAWLDLLRRAEEPVVLGRIGDYELECEVSRGGQGVVFRARQPITNQPIALKRMLAGSFATAGMRRRFEREVEAAALLNHPNIVSVYGMETIESVPVFAMEWVDGVPVNEWARGRDPDAILELFGRLCDAIQHAHSRGVLHRDLKPSNILVDAMDQPRVLDFGLAKHGPLSADGDPGSLSKSAEVFGTPAYASPEQLSGAETRLDPRTDVYALGVLLFELLTGKSPYGEWDGIPELLLKVGKVRTPRVSAGDPRLGRQLDTIVRTATQPVRTERYRSVELFAADVRSYLAGEPIQALPVSSWSLFSSLVRKNPVVSTLSLSLVVVSLIFGVTSTLQTRKLEAALKRTQESERDARTALDYCLLEMGVDGQPALVKPSMGPEPFSRNPYPVAGVPVTGPPEVHPAPVDEP